MVRFLLTSPGPRPPYYRLAEHLWGADCNFDSDGDSAHPEATDWTELTVTLRTASSEPYLGDPQRVDVDPLQEGTSLVLSIVSDSENLARRAADFLHTQAGGELTVG